MDALRTMWPGLLIVIVVGLVLILAARGTQGSEGVVDLSVSPTGVVIVPRGVWKILSLRNRLVIPLQDISDCVRDPRAADNHPVALRLAGTSAPGMSLRAGYMSGPDGRSWWAYRNGSHAIVLTLQNERLSYVVAEVDDPTGAVQRIMRALRR